MLGGEIVFSCKDNGLGIDLEVHKNKIFKLNKVFHDHPDARGVGLFITKKQVETLGGSISVISEPDKGAEFIINFGEAYEPKEVNLVCVVDDDKAYRISLLEQLTIKGVHENLLMFPNGQPAIKFLTENSYNAEALPDVILLNLNMPIMDGWLFLEKYQKIITDLVKPIKIYVVSSSISDQKKIDALLAQGVIEAVILKDELANRLNTII
jgi:CheY-like chemotaxis protein